LKKNFLVLGIGNAQVDLLERLSGRFFVHALSNSSNGRGLPYADYFEMVDIADKYSVLDYAKQHGIDYIYSVGSDIAMPTAAFVAEHLGLPILASYDVAITCNNKVELREKLRETYGAVAFALISEPGQIANVPLPAMIKPVDSQGQRGVQTISDQSQISKAFEIAIGYSRSRLAIIEQKILGQEISVNCYMVDGQLKFFLPSNRISWSQFEGGIIHKHILPSSLHQNAVANVEQLIKETTTTLGLINGPVYFQIMMRGDTPYLIEVTPRLDGCHMWRLIKYATGVDLLECAISQLQGMSLTFPDKYSLDKGTLEFFCQPPGELFLEIAPHPDKKHVEYFYRPGEKVKSINGYMEKCGYQIVLENDKE